MIAHLDIDAFFASVAEREQPELRGRPLAVCRDSRRAVVLTANYEARKYGVRSAMPLYLARERCPHLVLAEPRPELYRSLSACIFALIEADGYAFERLSLDEGYLDLTLLDFDGARAYTADLRARIREATALTVSAGLGRTKLIAKIASDAAKPDGLLAVAPGTEEAFLAPLPVGRLPGVGPKLQARLAEFDLALIGEIAALAPERAALIFGRGAQAYAELARGVDGRTVVTERIRKSLSTETTFEINRRGDEAILPVLREQARELADELAAKGFRAGSVGLKLKRTDFTIRSRQTQLREPTADPRVLFAAARYCWRSSGHAEIPLRLVGLRAGDLWSGAPRQLALFDASPIARPTPRLPAQEARDDGDECDRR